MTEHLFRSHGRVEIGGNHTDHQRGRVLTAAIDLEMTCTAAVNNTNIVRIESDRFGVSLVTLDDLRPVDEEKGTTSALIRGIAARFREKGNDIAGFDAKISSGIPVGAGLSSSAAFEVLIGNVFKSLFNADMSPLDIAIAGQFAENVYFGKPCGLMDQIACSYGGLMMIDLKDPQQPEITQIDADIDGYSMCVVYTGDSHADLTGDYAAIPAEMKAVAAFFGRDYLRAVDKKAFYSAIGQLRHIGDRAVLRAMHFFEENERALLQAVAMKERNIPEFLRLVSESGRSSMMYLQNIFTPGNPNEQSLTLALALCGQILCGEGAFRVHGGGFAGSILTFVPDRLKAEFISRISEVFGEGCCLVLKICNESSGEIHA